MEGGSDGASRIMFWNCVARWISTASLSGNLLKTDSGSVDAPCCTDPAMRYSLRQIDERRSIDVDVVELGGDRFIDQRLERFHFRRAAIGRRPFFRAGLKVIALDEDRTFVAFFDRGGEHARGVFGGTLFRVADLGA